MNSKDIWKNEYSVGLYDEDDEILYFYCNSLKILTDETLRNKGNLINDFLWDSNPDYASCMNYILALKILNHIKWHKMDCFGISPKGFTMSLIKMTPNEKDYFKIIF